MMGPCSGMGFTWIRTCDSHGLFQPMTSAITTSNMAHTLYKIGEIHVMLANRWTLVLSGHPGTQMSHVQAHESYLGTRNVRAATCAPRKGLSH